MTFGKLIAAGAALAGGGIGWYVLYRMLHDEAPGKPTDAPVPSALPDAAPVAPTLSTPGSTGYKRVDAILPKLRAAAEAGNVPLGLMVGWVCCESGGKLGDVTPKYDERGYFQLMPDESKGLGLDHARLSTDSDYSIDAGVKLIKKYSKAVDKLGVLSALPGSRFHWILTKWIHTVGGGDTKTLVQAAQAVDQANSWDELKAYALTGAAKTKHSPAKWVPFIDKLVKIGLPFGFETTATVAGLEEMGA